VCHCANAKGEIPQEFPYGLRNASVNLQKKKILTPKIFGDPFPLWSLVHLKINFLEEIILFL
jgi:hypothetical protein